MLLVFFYKIIIEKNSGNMRVVLKLMVNIMYINFDIIVFRRMCYFFYSLNFWDVLFIKVIDKCIIFLGCL